MSYISGTNSKEGDLLNALAIEVSFDESRELFAILVEKYGIDVPEVLCSQAAKLLPGKKKKFNHLNLMEAIAAADKQNKTRKEYILQKSAELLAIDKEELRNLTVIKGENYEI